MKDKIYARIIRRLLEDASAPDLGDIVWDPERKDAGRPRELSRAAPNMSPDELKSFGIEINTRDEREILQALQRWGKASASTASFASKRYVMQQSVADKLRSLMTSKYADVFREPNVERVYRGFTTKMDRLEKWLGKKPGSFYDNDSDAIEPRGVATGSWIMRPSAGAADSYTKDVSTAKFFSGMQGAYGSDTRVVFEAEISQNPGVFLDFEYLNVEYLQDAVLSLLTGEHEVIALGPVNVSKIYWGYGPGKMPFDNLR